GRNQQCAVDALDEDGDGNSLELSLLPYDDVRPPPSLVEMPAAGVHQTDSEDDSEESDLEEAEDGVVNLELKQPMKPLGVTSQEWRKQEAEGVTVDARDKPRQKPSFTAETLCWMSSQCSTILSARRMDRRPTEHTNPKLRGHDRLHVKLTKGELLQWWGYYALALATHTGIPIDEMWSDTPSPESILPPPMMGRHGMCINRFRTIRSVLAFGPSDKATLQADSWAFVRPLVDGFNQNRKENVTPGWLLTVDESMVAWRGRVGLLDPAKCPDRSWVPRKPEPLGVELKTAGDSLSGIMLRLEMCCEGTEAMKIKEFSNDWGATTACTLRLTEPWFRSSRVVAGDSDVKTNSSLFPKDALEAATPIESGNWATMNTTIALANGMEVLIYCVSHRRGETVHKFIAICGTTLKGESTKAYFADDVDRANSNLADFEPSRKAARVLNDYSLAQPCIDRRNRYRQFILALEKRLQTNNFSMRFATSMHADFKDQMGKLAYNLMHNDFLAAEQAQTSPKAAASAGRASSPESTRQDCGEHDLTPLKYVAGYQGYKQQLCIMRNRQTSWCCRSWTKGPFCLEPMCPIESRPRKGPRKGTTRKHNCFARHKANPALLPSHRRHAKRSRPAPGTHRTESEEDHDEDGWEDEVVMTD
ncbi:MAG: hypothetical protein SGPRY_007648, partial [Prymnesium sp.]